MWDFLYEERFSSESKSIQITQPLLLSWGLGEFEQLGKQQWRLVPDLSYDSLALGCLWITEIDKRLETGTGTHLKEGQKWFPSSLRTSSHSIQRFYSSPKEKSNQLSYPLSRRKLELLVFPQTGQYLSMLILDLDKSSPLPLIHSESRTRL